MRPSRASREVSTIIGTPIADSMRSAAFAYIFGLSRQPSRYSFRLISTLVRDEKSSLKMSKTSAMAPLPAPHHAGTAAGKATIPCLLRFRGSRFSQGTSNQGTSKFDSRHLTSPFRERCAQELPHLCCGVTNRNNFDERLFLV